MKKVIYIIPIILLTASCNNMPDTSGEIAIPMEKKTEHKEIDLSKMDPVCEMEMDSTWTAITIYQKDTIHFCSDQCKKAFDARPEKYAKK